MGSRARPTSASTTMTIPDGVIHISGSGMVIVVLALVGRARLPTAAGDPYESGEE